MLVLQAMVAQLLARHPDGEAIFRRLENFPTGLEPSVDQSKETFDYLADMSAGAQDTIDEIQRMINLAGGFEK